MLSSTNALGQADAEDDDEDDEDAESWSAEGHFTNANYQAKKMIFLSLINRKSFSDG
jgi:DNA mismatch repair protein MLH1